MGVPLPHPEDFDLLFVLGGPMGIHDSREFPWLTAEKKFIETCIRSGKKIIGICLGAQLIADVLGAGVFRNDSKEIGWHRVNRLPSHKNKISDLLPESFMAFHWHGDTFDIPKGAIHLAESEACSNQAFLYDSRVLGLQFHLESTESSIKDLYLNCSDELDGTTWVQSPEEILSTEHISDSNRIIKTLVDTITVGNN